MLKGKETVTVDIGSKGSSVTVQIKKKVLTMYKICNKC